MTWTVVHIGITIVLVIANLILVRITRRCVRMFQSISESQDRVTMRQGETNEMQAELVDIQRTHQEDLMRFRTDLVRRAELLTLHPDTRRN